MLSMATSLGTSLPTDLFALLVSARLSTASTTCFGISSVCEAGMASFSTFISSTSGTSCAGAAAAFSASTAAAGGSDDVATVKETPSCSEAFSPSIFFST
ncbi:hypothetical protein ACFX1R_034914 [Malus domestica]